MPAGVAFSITHCRGIAAFLRSFRLHILGSYDDCAHDYGYAGHRRSSKEKNSSGAGNNFSASVESVEPCPYKMVMSARLCRLFWFVIPIRPVKSGVVQVNVISFHFVGPSKVVVGRLNVI
jgi:hypothetical protein